MTRTTNYQIKKLCTLASVSMTVSRTPTSFFIEMMSKNLRLSKSLSGMGTVCVLCLSVMEGLDNIYIFYTLHKERTFFI